MSITALSILALVDEMATKFGMPGGFACGRSGTIHTGELASAGSFGHQAFIALAATSSGLSGKPYLVRCESAPAVDSGSWLLDRLKTIRMRNVPNGTREQMGT